MVLVNLIYLYEYVLALTCLKGQYRGVFACICNTFERPAVTNENLKTMVRFLFRPRTSLVKLLKSVFGHRWPEWKCITT